MRRRAGALESRMPRHRLTTAISFAALVIVPPAYGVAAEASWVPDALSANVGFGNDVDIYGAGARWNLSPPWSFLANHDLDLRLDLTAAYWRGMGRPTPYGHLWELGLTPILRKTWAGTGTWRYYLEAGIGPHALTATRINNSRLFGIAFQFGSVVGAGVAFGPRHEYEVGLYVKHVSNADLATANWGLTYPGIVVRIAIP